MPKPRLRMLGAVVLCLLGLSAPVISAASPPGTWQMLGPAARRTFPLRPPRPAWRYFRPEPFFLPRERARPSEKHPEPRRVSAPYSRGLPSALLSLPGAGDVEYGDATV